MHMKSSTRWLAGGFALLVVVGCKRADQDSPKASDTTPTVPLLTRLAAEPDAEPEPDITFKAYGDVTARRTQRRDVRADSRLMARRGLRVTGKPKALAGLVS